MRREAHSAGRVELPGGDRPKIQIVSVKDLIEGPDLGITTALDVIGAADAARDQARRQQKAKQKPSPANLRREPELPPMSIPGGKKGRDQVALPLDEPVLVEQQAPKRGKGRSAA